MSEKDDQDIQRLLKAAGPRENPPEDMRERVRAEVLAAWNDMPVRPGRRSARAYLAMAASLVAAVAAVWFVLTANDGSGAAEWAAEVAASNGAYTLSQEVSVGRLGKNSMVTTEANGWVMLRLAGGADVQLDERTRITISDGDSIALSDGRIYVDGGAGSMSNIRVATPHAVITNVGTLFEVAVDGDEMTVAMREGEVAISLGERSYPARAAAGAGDGLRFAGIRKTDEFTLATTDDRWGWVRPLRSPFDAPRTSVFDYLEWAARDTGRTLQMSAIVKEMSKQEFLAGNARFGSGRSDVATVLQSTSFELVAARDEHRLVVEFRDERG